MFSGLIDHFRRGEQLKTDVIFRQFNQHEIALHQIETSKGVYVDITMNCYGRNRFRLPWDNFVRQLVPVRHLYQQITNGNYKELDFQEAAFSVPSPMPRLFETAEKIGPAAVLLRSASGQAFMTFAIIKSDEYRASLGVFDTLSGSRYDISIEEARNMLERLIAFGE